MDNNLDSNENWENNNTKSGSSDQNQHFNNDQIYYDDQYKAQNNQNNVNNQMIYSNNDYNQNSSSVFYTNQNYEEIPEEGKGFSVASIILSILSLLCCCVPGFGLMIGILGLIFGILGVKKQNNPLSGLAIAGIIVSIIGILVGIYYLIYFIIVLLATDMEAARNVDLSDPNSVRDYVERMEREVTFIRTLF